MRYIFIVLICNYFFFCSSSKQISRIKIISDSSEQDSISNYFLFDYINTLIENDFTLKLDSIKNEISNDFFTLRMAYTKTKNYSPYGSEISDSLKKVVSLIDSSKYDLALSKLEYVLDKNYVNIRAHLYSGYIYRQLGDSVISNYHYKVYEGLLTSILESGDGSTPKTAYIVISTKEEYDFLNWFNLQFNRQSLVSFDGYHFDFMEVKDRETDEEHKIYFNIDIAFSLMSKAFSK